MGYTYEYLKRHQRRKKGFFNYMLNYSTDAERWLAILVIMLASGILGWVLGYVL